MKAKSELERLAAAVRKAEAELEAAKKLSDVTAAARKLMRASAELKRFQEKPAGATRPTASRAAPAAGGS